MSDNTNDNYEKEELQIVKLKEKLAKDKLENFLTNDEKNELLLQIEKEYENNYIQCNDKCLESALVLAKKIDDTNNPLKQIKIYMLLTAKKNNSLEFDKAIEYTLKALKISKNDDTSARIKLALSMTYMSTNKYDQAFEVLKESEKAFLKSDNFRGLAAVCNNIGAIYYEKKELDKAFYYYKKSLNYYDENSEENVNLVSSLYMNTGLLSLEKKDYENALLYTNKALNIYKDKNKDLDTSLVLFNLANIYYELKDHANTEKYLEQCYNLASKINANSVLVEVYQKYKQYYQSIGDYSKAIHYYDLFYELKETLFDSEKEKISKELSTKYKIEQKEKELILEQKRNQELKETHEEIIRLEKKNSVLAMIVTANHEINQPLSILKSNIGILKKKLEKESVIIENHEIIFNRTFESINKISKILEKYRSGTDKISYADYGRDTEMVIFDDKNKKKH